MMKKLMNGPFKNQQTTVRSHYGHGSISCDWMIKLNPFTALVATE